MRALIVMVWAGWAGCAGESELRCEVAVVGGGAGGLHTAFRLAPQLHDRVCLFEAQPELGGRIHDVAFDAADPSAPRFGTGARRVMEGQEVLFALAAELGITLEKPDLGADLINARGAFGFAKDDFLPVYPGVERDQDPDVDQETWLYDRLRKGPARARAAEYPEFRSYIRDVVGGEEYQFLHDMSRFRADFEYPLDARGYLDYLDEEWDVCCTPSYPVGGMSEFIRRMEAQAKAAGARIFKGEPVLKIDRAGGRYRVETHGHLVDAAKLVLAIPPVALDQLDGDVARRVRAQEEYQKIIGVRVVTVTQWWSDAWWTAVHDDKDAQVWRAWTTEHCLNFIEIPLEPYAVAQKVTRSVYDDDAACVAFWEEAAKGGAAAVEAEIQRGLEHLFSGNGVSKPARVTVPAPLKTHVQVWPAAWHWLRAGSPYTNAQLAEWAVAPLPGEEVALVGEAYNPQRSGWSDAAYKSSLKLLVAKYGFQPR